MQRANMASYVCKLQPTGSSVQEGCCSGRCSSCTKGIEQNRTKLGERVVESSKAWLTAGRHVSTIEHEGQGWLQDPYARVWLML